MSGVGFTKARSMGPVADAIARAGGSAARIFRKAELPLRLIETPDQLIPLRDQLALVEYAAQELDDAALPLRLSTQGGVAALGCFGRSVLAAPTLAGAIARCNGLISTQLQSMTHMTLTITDRTAIWSYVISDGARIGREKNELLAFGYMSDTLRRYGVAAPARATLPRLPAARGALEGLMRCDIAHGETAALVFPAEALHNPNPSPGHSGDGSIADMPAPGDFRAIVEQMTRLALLGRRPTLGYVSRRLALSARSLQRRLESDGASFESIRRGVLLARAEALLATSTPIIGIAYELGYADPAHFTRAFVRWTGENPRARRRGLAGGPAGSLAAAAARL